MRALSTVTVAFIATLFVAGCAQSPSPTVPSLASSVASTAAGPGASYDASGVWRLVSTGEDPFDTTVTQDADGNLHFLDEDGTPLTLERLGTGVVITYRLFLIGSEGDCQFRLQGTIRLDTRTNTLAGNVGLKGLGSCSDGRQRSEVTGTKL